MRPNNFRFSRCSKAMRMQSSASFGVQSVAGWPRSTGRSGGHKCLHVCPFWGVPSPHPPAGAVPSSQHTTHFRPSKNRTLLVCPGFSMLFHPSVFWDPQVTPCGGGTPPLGGPRARRTAQVKAQTGLQAPRLPSIQRLETLAATYYTHGFFRLFFQAPAEKQSSSVQKLVWCSEARFVYQGTVGSNISESRPTGRLGCASARLSEFLVLIVCFPAHSVTRTSLRFVPRTAGHYF